MKTPLLISAIACFAVTAPATVRYVDLNSPSPTPPYTNWLTAATNIQDAITSAVPGDLVLVTNGIYETGVSANSGSNRVNVTKAVKIESVNGPGHTVIRGYQVPSVTNGASSIRGVYLTGGATLSGFTLLDGSTLTNGYGGAVYCAASNAVVTNCIIKGNVAGLRGGGIYSGTARNCVLEQNSAGAASGTGGGAYGAILINCVVRSNSATSGGGTYLGALTNCAVYANRALDNGGGAYMGSLNNCTITGNSAGSSGGGTYHNNNDTTRALNNCIIYYNTAPDSPNYIVLFTDNLPKYCCTTPLPASGTANTNAEPQLASAIHLSTNSPCRGAGSSIYLSSRDIDGELWNNPPAIGCDEYRVGAAGSLTVRIQPAYTNVAVGFNLNLTGFVEGHADCTVWNFGDATVSSNRPYASHSWAAPGDYAVVFSAFNDSNPGGVSATVTVHVASQPIHHVALESTNPVSPYLSWATAATNIQNAVDAAFAGGVVLVSNGVYTTGARVVHGGMSNRVVVNKPIELRSVNGPGATAIRGEQVQYYFTGSNAVRCVYLADGASLNGFTLTNGATTQAGNGVREQSGGGVWCESANVTLSNCVMLGNAAYIAGGGVYRGALWNCVLTTNRSASAGAGASGSTLNSCLITNNAAASGGGASGSILNDCVVVGNSAYNGGAGAAYSTLNRCIVSNNVTSSGGGGGDSCTFNACKILNNQADDYGGGAYYSTLNNCLIIGNTAKYAGGGACNCWLNNCTFVANSSVFRGGGVAYVSNSGFTYQANNCVLQGNICTNGAEFSPHYGHIFRINYSCVAPLPTNGVGNITGPALFVDEAAANFRLQTNSPCIDAGTNSTAAGLFDHDGRSRLLGGTMDMGAYEFQGGNMGEFIGWLEQLGLPTDGSADYSDSDSDAANNWQEWRADTIPTNALSVLRMVSATNGASGLNVTWQSVSTRNYWLERATNLGNVPPFQIIATTIAGAAGTKSYTDTSATNGGPYFYRVSVQP